LAKEKGYIFQEVSAKQGTNINNLFYQDIFTQIGRKFNIIEEEGNPGVNNPEQQNDNFRIDSNRNNTTTTNKKKCC
jgi:hypothetical protein